MNKLREITPSLGQLDIQELGKLHYMLFTILSKIACANIHVIWKVYSGYFINLTDLQCVPAVWLAI